MQMTSEQYDWPDHLTKEGRKLTKRLSALFPNSEVRSIKRSEEVLTEVSYLQ